MRHLPGLFGWFTLLVVASHVGALKSPSLNISSRCLGNIMRVEVGPLGGNLLEVAVVYNRSAVILTKSLASQCGFSMKIDRLGNAVIYVSLQNCFALNLDDESFTTALRLRLYGKRLPKDELYQVTETCLYSEWTSREIVCDHNYMEVSVRKAAPSDYALPEHPLPQSNDKFGYPRRAAKKLPIDAGFAIKTVVIYTPEEKMMTVTEAQRSGYAVTNTPSRLVLRTSKTSPDIYTVNVAGVPMLMFKTSTIFEKTWQATQIDAAAACPLPEGSVSFTSNLITWYLPRHIDPLISSGQFQLLEVHMGVDGQRLTPSEVQARRYSISVSDVHIVIDIPLGAAGGFFKSYIQEGHYFTAYTIEPMVELLWTEDAGHEHTRYKVLFPITTPLIPQPPKVIDNTVPEQQVFKLVLGHFAPDVALVNITFPTGVLSLEECIVRGFKVLEHLSPNGTFKAFTLEVPFTDPVVLQMKEKGLIIYTLHLTFGLLVLTDFVPFSHTAVLEASLVDIAPPSVVGSCDNLNFYILVKYGTQGPNFQTIVGKQVLTQELAKDYGFWENETHFSLVVPFSAPAVVIEAIQSTSLRSRLDVVLKNPETNVHIQEFALACNFFSVLTECFSNGTMTAIALKLESVPTLNPALLTLRDPSCGPVHSNDRYAYFVFTANSCGTTRKFLPNVMLYENEISLPDELQGKRNLKSDDPEYELKVSCYYDINTTHAVSFHTRPRRSEPFAENAKGQHQVELRLALDDSFTTFHKVEDYPISKPLLQPLYFEVALIKAANPKVSLELENCWGTLNEDRTSQPRWNLIINGCPNPVDPYQVIFHPVWPDARVQHPSLYKRFEVKMFAFAEDQDNLSGQLFVHCDVVICDARNPMGGVCNGQCPNPQNGTRGQRRAISEGHSFKHVSVGPIVGY
ncbi:uncharacterized protein LOC115401880 [Salarias fasciatus]|uniref:uncharacterized protein LOC115401880 n=1 Tax=Salarias fasciatus TaxID=181472 RepID=UPI001176DE9F|nr:uncharacterized protein LOC115401880 [Salarias fasciatus]